MPSTELCQALDRIADKFIRCRYLDELVFKRIGSPGKTKDTEKDNHLRLNALIGASKHLSIQNCKLVHRLYICCILKTLNSLTIENSPVRLFTSAKENEIFITYLEKSLENAQAIHTITLSHPNFSIPKGED